jgi:hypothetical protein
MKSILLACLVFAACTDEKMLGTTTPPTPPDGPSAPAGPTGIGTPRWAVSIGTWANDAAEAIAIDSLGDVVAVGVTTTSPDQGSANVPTAPSAGFITKRVASDGSERWRVTLSGSGEDSVTAEAVAIDGSNDVIVVGDFTGSVDFGGQTLTTAPQTGDAFVAEYASTGDLVWVDDLLALIGGAGLELDAIAVGADGKLIAGGLFEGTVELSGQSYTASTTFQGFVAAFDPTGTVAWGQGFSAQSIAQSLAVDPNGDVLVAGNFNEPTSFGGATLDPAGTSSTYLARYRGSDGLYLSSDVVDGGANAQVVVDSTGRVAVQTAVGSTASLGWSTMLDVADSSDTPLWSTPIPDTGDVGPQPRALSTTPSGLILSSAWDYSFSGGMATGELDVSAFGSDATPGVTSAGSLVTRVGGGTQVRASAVGSTGAVALAGTLNDDIAIGTTTLTHVGTEDTDALIVLIDPP